jgi:hypothetical protein
MTETRLNHGKVRSVRRRALAAGAGLLLLLGVAGEARALSEKDLPSGRLGYKWVPTPQQGPGMEPDEMAVTLAKVGAGSVAAIWVLRKLAGAE